MRRLLLCVALLLPTLALSTEADPYRRMVEGNLRWRSHAEARAGAEERTGALERSFLPTLSLEAGQEQFQTGSYASRLEPYGKLEARLNLYRGGRDGIDEHLRELRLRRATQAMDRDQREELRQVRRLRHEIIYNRQLRELRQRELAACQRVRTQVEQRVRSGVISRTDVLEFSLHESELTEEIEALEHENRIHLIGLRPLLGLAPDAALEIAGNLEHEHDDELMGRAVPLTPTPAVAVLTADAELVALERKSEARWWVPRVDLYGGQYLYTLRERDYISQRRRDDTAIGVRLSMELFDGGAAGAEASALAFEARAKELRAQHADAQARASFRMLQEDLRHTHEVIHYVLDRIAKSRDYLARTLTEYDRGVKNSLDALAALQRYYRYEQQHLEKKKEYQLLKAELMAQVGE